MIFFSFRLISPHFPADPRDVDLVLDALERGAVEAPHVEHLRAHRSPMGVVGVVFCPGSNLSHARRVCHELCLAALSEAGRPGWQTVLESA